MDPAEQSLIQRSVRAQLLVPNFKSLQPKSPEPGTLPSGPKPLSFLNPFDVMPNQQNVAANLNTSDV